MHQVASTSSFSLHPTLWIAIAFSAGIGTASVIDIPLQNLIGLSVAFAVVALLFRTRLAATFLILAAFAAAGMMTCTAERKGVQPDRIKLLYDTGEIISGDPVEIEGVLTTAPELSADGHFLTLRTQRLRGRNTDRQVSGRVRLFVPVTPAADLPILNYGSHIIVRCILEREDEYLNPGVLRRPDYLDQIDIDATGSVKSPLLIEHLADESVFLPLKWVYNQRASLIDTFISELSSPAAGVMTASLLGDKYFLDAVTADAFREGGTFHVLVISGLHITFIGGILLLLLRRMTRNRSIQFLVTGGFLWAYTLAVGAEVPVVRAAVMFTVVLYSYVVYRPTSMLNSLGFCALLLLAWHPSDLFTPSFHLTFVSVASIVAIAYPLIESIRKIGAWSPSAKIPFPPDVSHTLRRVCETLYWDNEAWAFERNRQIWSANLFKSPYFRGQLKGALQKVVRYIIEGLVVSFIVQICMLPLLIVYFHRLSFVSIVLNLWVGFFIAVESMAAVAAVLLKSLSPLIAAPLFLFAETINWLMMLAPRLFTGHGWSGLRLPVYSGAGRSVYILYYALLIGAAYAIRRWAQGNSSKDSRSRAVVFALGMMLIGHTAVMILHPYSAPKPDSRLKIDFLDVGQGDAALVTFPDGPTMLIDGGGQMQYRRSGEEATQDFERDVRRIGESVVSEFLWQRGYSRMDYILATHSDTDHMQGLVDIANNFTIGTALIGRAATGDPDYDELSHTLSSHAIPTAFVLSGDTFTIGDVLIEVLNPGEVKERPGLSNNDSSVVVKLTYKDRSFLLTGDIESAAEAEIIASGAKLAVDVVKVPHHGSRTSSTTGFVDSVDPQFAVISVGRHSLFGHPHPEIVERWRLTGADVRTTGDKGMVTISTDGSDLQISTFVQ
jgi:competence protein ComEC